MFLVNTMRKFPEPYDVLDEPGGIIIDRDGIIREIIPRAMTEEEIRRAAGLNSNETIRRCSYNKINPPDRYAPR